MTEFRLGLGSLALDLVATVADRPGSHRERLQAPGDLDRWLVETDSVYGRLRHARSPLGFAGLATDWDHPPSRWGTDEPRWASTAPA